MDYKEAIFQSFIPTGYDVPNAMIPTSPYEFLSVIWNNPQHKVKLSPTQMETMTQTFMNITVSCICTFGYPNNMTKMPDCFYLNTSATITHFLHKMLSQLISSNNRYASDIRTKLNNMYENKDDIELIQVCQAYKSYFNTILIIGQGIKREIATLQPIIELVDFLPQLENFNEQISKIMDYVDECKVDDRDAVDREGILTRKFSNLNSQIPQFKLEIERQMAHICSAFQPFFDPPFDQFSKYLHVITSTAQDLVFYLIEISYFTPISPVLINDLQSFSESIFKFANSLNSLIRLRCNYELVNSRITAHSSRIKMYLNQFQAQFLTTINQISSVNKGTLGQRVYSSISEMTNKMKEFPTKYHELLSNLKQLPDYCIIEPVSHLSSELSPEITNIMSISFRIARSILFLDYSPKRIIGMADLLDSKYHHFLDIVQKDLHVRKHKSAMKRRIGTIIKHNVVQYAVTIFSSALSDFSASAPDADKEMLRSKAGLAAINFIIELSIIVETNYNCTTNINQAFDILNQYLSSCEAISSSGYILYKRAIQLMIHHNLCLFSNIMTQLLEIYQQLGVSVDQSIIDLNRALRKFLKSQKKKISYNHVNLYDDMILKCVKFLYSSITRFEVHPIYHDSIYESILLLDPIYQRLLDSFSKRDLIGWEYDEDIMSNFINQAQENAELFSLNVQKDVSQLSYYGLSFSNSLFDIILLASCKSGISQEFLADLAHYSKVLLDISVEMSLGAVNQARNIIDVLKTINELLDSLSTNDISSSSKHKSSQEKYTKIVTILQSIPGILGDISHSNGNQQAQSKTVLFKNKSVERCYSCDLWSLRSSPIPESSLSLLSHCITPQYVETFSTFTPRKKDKVRRSTIDYCQLEESIKKFDDSDDEINEYDNNK